MPKDKSKGKGAVPLRASLGAEIDQDSAAAYVSAKSSKRRRNATENAAGGHENNREEGFVPARLTQKILRQAREQQAEDAEEEEGIAGEKHVRFQGTGRLDDDSGDEIEEYEEGDDEAVAFGEDDDVDLDGGFVGARGGASDREDAAILRKFMPDDAGTRRTLADIIMEKLEEARARAHTGPIPPDGAPGTGALDPRVVTVYSDVGKYLASYRSGKLPKVMKVIPSLAAWEDVLFLTNPESWTPHATYAATRIFASNLNAAKAQRFFNLVLLPKCRDDIFVHKKLNFHLYLALRKATYKPAAFYRGILLPLAAGGDCTLQEAVILASVVKKSSIPQLHSAAALVKLAGLPYSGAVSVFLSALLDKKYTLPYMALDAVVDHFTGFYDVDGPLPILWQTCLLSLARRYKADLAAEQKDNLKKLTHRHPHLAISAEVRRELAAAPARGQMPSQAQQVVAPAAASSVSQVAPKLNQRKAGRSADEEMHF